MMELFRREIFRPVMTLLVPGATALAPYMLILLASYPPLSAFLDKSPTSVLVVALLIGVALGLIIEDIGSCIEKGWDSLLEKETGRHKSDWKAYLRLTLDSDSVAIEYMNDILLSLKFELGFSLALLIAWPGLWWYDSLFDVFSKVSFVIASILIFLLAGYLLWESFSSAKLLGETRALLLEKQRSD